MLSETVAKNVGVVSKCLYYWITIFWAYVLHV